MVIIYNDLDSAQSLCDRLKLLKSEKDLNYSKPIKHYQNNEWFVQILQKHEGVLTDNELSQLVELPTNWFPDDLV